MSWSTPSLASLTHLFAVALLANCSLQAPSDEQLLHGYGGGHASGASGATNADAHGGTAASGGRTSDGGKTGSASGGFGTSGGVSADAGREDEPGGAAAAAGEPGVGAGAGGADAVGGNASGPMCGGESCPANSQCSVGDGRIHCDCVQGFLLDENSCRRPHSCAELHQAWPNLPSGEYNVQPADSAALDVYCEMQQSGGGWTLILNEGTDFMPSTPGTDNAMCYRANCTSLAYSELPLQQDILLDVANADISGENYSARVQILGVNPASRNETLRSLFTQGPNFLEKGDNSNVQVFRANGASCQEALTPDLATLFCQDDCSDPTQSCGAPIMTLGDHDSACASTKDVVFAIGASKSESEAWTNCAGWPQAASLMDADGSVVNYYPTNFRIWIR